MYRRIAEAFAGSVQSTVQAAGEVGPPRLVLFTH